MMNTRKRVLQYMKVEIFFFFFFLMSSAEIIPSMLSVKVAVTLIFIICVHKTLRKQAYSNI